ncbi:MAG: dienelactone hydrolase family protein [Candidatus Thermoplasmatota archaeon]|nr:dienelactone hydrolase family protein [Candidatus Thermoplasmatota archaeon]
MNVYSTLTDEDEGKIAYLSASPFEVTHILRDMEKLPKHPVFGELLFPEKTSAQKMSCVVALHGSLGWRGHHQDHINNWLDAGIAVFQIHSFESRKILDVVEDQMMVTHAMMLADAFAALRLLRTHPRIDEERIGISGWSLGGTVALYSAWSPIIEALTSEGELFARHLPFYPAAHMQPEVNRWSSSPIRILHGDNDDYTPLHFVTQIIQIMQSSKADVGVHVYQGAGHSFDSKEEKKWLPNAIRLDHRSVRIDTEWNLWAEKEPGELMRLNEPAERLAAFQYAKNIGAHVGGDRDARPHALNYSTTFFLEM